MSYVGPERRRHRVFITDHTEYHVRGDQCVAVRDVRSGSWQKAHIAMGSRLQALLAPRERGGWRADVATISVGDKLYFSSDLLTGPVRVVTRPDPKMVSFYPETTAA